MHLAENRFGSKQAFLKFVQYCLGQPPGLSVAFPLPMFRAEEAALGAVRQECQVVEILNIAISRSNLKISQKRMRFEWLT